MPTDEIDLRHMRRALMLAEQGRGWVEPNPLVGCVIARGEQVLAEGWHRKFGGPHAEIEALTAAGDVHGATLYVTLEPCCHQGKTPPCTRAVIQAGIARVVAAQLDPFPQVAGRGFQELRAAGIQVTSGLLEQEANQLNAPYRKLLRQRQPWIIAKWAMSLDGKLATATGHSQWISSAASRQLVHQLRGQVDGILIGSGTAVADDPRLTARPPGPRCAVRILVDSRARLSLDSQLVQTLDQAPLLIAVSSEADPTHCQFLEQAGCELFRCPAADPRQRLVALLKELGRRQMTRILVEGGAGMFGALLDLQAIDEVHAFIAPILIGGQQALSPCGGEGVARIDQAPQLQSLTVERNDTDFHLHGFLVHKQPAEPPGLPQTPPRSPRPSQRGG